MDSDDENPWGEEPAWAKDDQRDVLEQQNQNETKGTSGNAATTTTTPWYTDFEEDGTTFGAQHVLVLIDCRPSMFVPCISFTKRKTRQSTTTNNTNDNNTIMISPFDAAIMACEKLLRLRVYHVAINKTGKRDGVGILLYGTKPQTQNSKNDSKKNRGNDKNTKLKNSERTTIGEKGFYEAKKNDPDNHDDNSSSSSSSHNDSDSETSDGEDSSSSLVEPTTSTHTLVDLCPPGIKEIKTVLECLDDHVRNQPRKRNLQEEYAATALDTNNNDTNETQDNSNNVRNDGVLDPSHVAQKMGQSTLCPLRSALHEASKTFASAKCVNNKASTSKSPGDSKTVWIFTNEEDPCYGNEEESKLVIMVAKDAMANGLDIQVWPLPRPFPSTTNNNGAAGAQNNHPSFSFRHDLFFHKICTKNSNSTIADFSLDYSSQQPSQQHGEQSASSSSNNQNNFDIDDMLDDIKRQWKKVRKAYSVPMFLPDWKDHPEYPGIQLDFFNIVQIQKKPTPIMIHQLTKKPIIKTHTRVTADTGEILSGPRGHEPERNVIQDDQNSEQSTGNNDRVRTFFKFGGERVFITRQEVQLIKRKSNAIDKPSLILLGFKPIDAIPMTHRLNRSYLGYPNDNVTRGSKVAFAHLHAAMIRKKVLAIGELLVRSNATSRLVALYPQQEKREILVQEEGEEEGGDSEEEKDGENHHGNGMTRQVAPPGLVLVELPYEDEVRDVANTTDAEKQAGVPEELVEAAMGLIRNQRLEGIEFGYDFPNYALAKFASHLEAVALDIPEEEIEDETAVDEKAVEEAVGPEIAAFKNALPEDEEVEKSRKRKVIAEDDSGIDWVDLYKTGSLSDCTIDKLKTYLRSVGERLSGRKEELVLRVTQHIENEVLPK